MFATLVILVSSLIQFAASVIVLRMIRFSNFKKSWTLIAIGFLLMASSQLLELYNNYKGVFSIDILNLYHWLNLVVTIFMTIGVILIGRLLRSVKKAEEQKLESERRFQMIFNNTSDEIFLADFEGNFIEVNQEVLNRLGYTMEELMMKNYRDIKTPKYMDLVQKNIDIIIRTGKHVYETEHVAKDGSVVSLEMSSRVIDYFGRKAILSIARDITERNQVERKIAEIIIETEERERKRFAADLHDGLAPLLSTIKLYSDLLKKGNLKKMTSEEAVGSIDELIDQAIVSTREISNNIMPTILRDFGLAAAVREFCNYINNTQSLKIVVDTDQYKIEKTGIEETVLFYAIKELVNNSVKHSEATTAEVFLENHEDQVNLMYKDNGKGFVVEEKLNQRSGLGLNNLVNKVKTLKGLCMIKSEEGKGMSVLVTITIHPPK